MKVKKIPMRTCVGCRVSKPKKELIRFVRTPEQRATLDASGKAQGRGAYICPDADCFEKARRRKVLGQALEISINAKDLADLEQAFSKYLAQTQS